MSTQLRERLSSLKLDIDTATAERHLAEISEALKAPQPQKKRRKGLAARLAPVMAAIALLLAPAAVAAESSVPGDLLFPVKQLTEEVRSWFDPGVVVDHRLDEAERLLDRDASAEVIRDRLDAANRALDELADDRIADFDDRLNRVRDRYAERHVDRREPSDVDPQRTVVTDDPDQPERDGQQDRPDVTTTAAPRDRQAGSDDPVSDEPTRDDARTTTTTTTTTTIPPRDGGTNDGSDSDGRNGDRPPGRGDG